MYSCCNVTTPAGKETAILSGSGGGNLGSAASPNSGGMAITPCTPLCRNATACVRVGYEWHASVLLLSLISVKSISACAVLLKLHGFDLHVAQTCCAWTCCISTCCTRIHSQSKQCSFSFVRCIYVRDTNTSQLTKPRDALLHALRVVHKTGQKSHFHLLVLVAWEILILFL